ncbi:class A sortase [Levilactobacillus huananensis]|uniref:class A sortase n=1 Tax=Levilactobacillus huananensis TaxID=2486019 RepID=UPI000F770BC6|nr:class A sortase [Levilactobacillus huananensis]
MTPRKRWVKWGSFGLLLMFLVGCGLVLLGLTQNFSVIHLGDKAKHEMTAASVQKATKQARRRVARGQTAAFDYGKTSQLTPLTVGSYGLRELFGNSAYRAVGELRVPAVGLDLPIGVGVSDAVLVRGAGTLKADQRMGTGNYALAGHYMTAKRLLFSPLAGVREGNNIYLTDKQQTYRYKVTRVWVTNRYHVEVIDDVPGKKMVTLVTCATANRGEQNRLVIRGERQAVKQVAV